MNKVKVEVVNICMCVLLFYCMSNIVLEEGCLVWLMIYIKKKVVRRFKLKNKKMKKLCNVNVFVDKYVFFLLSIM